MILTDKIIKDFKACKLDGFYECAYSSLVTYAMRLFGDNYDFISEDCLHETILKSYEHRSSFISASQWKSFLYTTLHNSCISILRKHNAMTNYLAENDEHIEADCIQTIICHKAFDTLFSIIDNLPPRLHRIFEISLEEGLRNTEIADRLNISISGVRNRNPNYSNMCDYN